MGTLSQSPPDIQLLTLKISQMEVRGAPGLTQIISLFHGSMSFSTSCPSPPPAHTNAAPNSSTTPMPKPTNCICAAIVNTWSCGCHTYTYRVTCLGPIYHDPPRVVASKLHWRETCEKCGERLPAAERAWMQRRGVLEYATKEGDIGIFVGVSSCGCADCTRLY
jgi:hypothetical protein